MEKIYYAFIGFALMGIVSCQEIRTVKITVVEEDKTPIEGVDAIVTFLGYSGKTTQKVNGKTDSSGVFAASGNPQLRMHVRLEKEGYYYTKSDRLSREANHDVTYVMRKIKSPRALYARRVFLGFPVNREWIGYDFEIGDWVEPYGEGKVRDALFRCDTENAGERGGKGSFEFKFNEDEGLSPVTDQYLNFSAMKMPHEAPFNGYETSFKREANSYHDENFQNDIGYFFRSRVRKENDKIISSHYGKIIGGIRFDPRESGWHASDRNRPKSFANLSFTYYFNPTSNDRNLEFDPQQNLFINLNPTEQVREP